MDWTRREWMAAVTASAAQAASERQEQPVRKHPMLCLFSKHLPELQYTELGPVLKDMGFEGCDLTVRPGGHVLPEKANVDLLRAIECIRGDGVEVPVITTNLVSTSQTEALPVLAIAGRMNVPYFKPGYWTYRPTDDIPTKLAKVRQDVAGLVSLGRHFNIALGFHNHSGYHVGEAVWDIHEIIAGMDPRWAGHYFDPCHATAEGGVAGWEISLRLALPRLKMVALKDFYWAKTNGKWKMTMCPIGEGMVDWPKFFSMLAAARFTGPLSLHLEYHPEQKLAAIARDLEFVKKQVALAYG